MKTCRKGLHEYPEGKARCPKCKAAYQSAHPEQRAAYRAAHREQAATYNAAYRATHHHAARLVAYRARRPELKRLFQQQANNAARRRRNIAALEASLGI